MVDDPDERGQKEGDRDQTKVVGPVVVQVETAHVIATAKGAALAEIVVTVVGVALADQAADYEQVQHEPARAWRQTVSIESAQHFD